MDIIAKSHHSVRNKLAVPRIIIQHKSYNDLNALSSAVPDYRARSELPGGQVYGRGLPGRRRALLRVEEQDQPAALGHAAQGGRGGARVPYAREAAKGGGGQFLRQITGAEGLHRAGEEPLPVREGDAVGLRVDFGDEHPPARGEAEAAALAERVAVYPAVLADHPAVIYERPGAGRAASALYPGGEVPVRHEAELHAVALFGAGQAEGGGERAHLALFIAAERQHEPP